MRWRVFSGPVRLPDRDDQWRWLYLLRSPAGQTRKLTVSVSGSAMSMAADCLAPEVSELRLDLGRSALARCLDWPEPPRRIEANTGWINLRFDSGALARL